VPVATETAKGVLEEVAGQVLNHEANERVMAERTSAALNAPCRTRERVISIRKAPLPRSRIDERGELTSVTGKET
jgi:hypothetical protein